MPATPTPAYGGQHNLGGTYRAARTLPAFLGNTSTFATDNRIYSGHIDYAGVIDSYNVELLAGQEIQVTNWTGHTLPHYHHSYWVPTPRTRLAESYFRDYLSRNADYFGRHTNLRTGSGYIYGIYDSSGNLQANTTAYDNHRVGVSQGVMGRMGSVVNYVASTSGTYRVDVGRNLSEVGSYNLDVRIGPRHLSFGATGFASVNGFIDSGEQDGANDVYAFNAIQYHTYTVRMQGSPSGNGTLSDTYIRGIYFGNDTSTSLGSNDDSGGTLDSLLTFTAGSTGTYRIHAGAYGNNTGTYRLSIQRLTSVSNCRPPPYEQFFIANPFA